MAVTTDILRSYRTPRQVVRELLGMGEREDRAFAYLMLACVLVFVAQLPRLSRKAHLETNTQTAEETAELAAGGWSYLHQLVAYEVLAWLIVWPLFFYLIALVLHIARRALGSKASPFQTRLALFWAFLAASPLALLFGLTTGFVGPGPQATLVGALWIGGFVIFVAAGFRAGRG